MTNESAIRQLQSRNVEARLAAIKCFSRKFPLSDRELEALVALENEDDYLANQDFALCIVRHPKLKCLPSFLKILESESALSLALALESLPAWVEKKGEFDLDLEEEFSKRLTQLVEHQVLWIRFLACLRLGSLKGRSHYDMKELARIVQVADEALYRGLRSQAEEILLEPELQRLNTALTELGLDLLEAQ